MKNPFETANRNELTILRLVHKYGHLRRQDIARAVWPTSSIPSSLVMAQRTLDRLVDKKHLSKAVNTLGGISYLLTATGANRLELKGEHAVKSGRGISSVFGSQFFHRTLGTRYLIEKEIAGFEAYGEYAIYRGLLGVDRDLFVKKFGKIPDGLLLSKGSARGFDADITTVDWVEVESFYKPPHELRKILTVSESRGTWINPEKRLMLDRLVFVHSTVHSHEESLLRTITTYLAEHKVTNPNVLSNIVIAKCEVTAPFVWRGFTESNWLAMQESKVTVPPRSASALY